MMTRDFLAVLTGILFSLVFFFAIFNPPTVPKWRYGGVFVRYVGTVVAQDARTITIEIPSIFALAKTASGKIRFDIDRDTIWYGLTFRFDDAVAIEREDGIESAQSLPLGTLVRVMRDPDAPGIRAQSITLYKRTTL